jgi:hypothetical protein
LLPRSPGETSFSGGIRLVAAGFGVSRASAFQVEVEWGRN